MPITREQFNNVARFFTVQHHEEHLERVLLEAAEEMQKLGIVTLASREERAAKGGRNRQFVGGNDRSAE